MALEEGAVAQHLTEKFLILNILQTLVEDEKISPDNQKICRKAVFSSKNFNAKSLMSYAPPHWEQAQQNAGLKVRENFPAPNLGSCFLLLHEVGAFCKLWVFLFSVVVFVWD